MFVSVRRLREPEFMFSLLKCRLRMMNLAGAAETTESPPGTEIFLKDLGWTLFLSQGTMPLGILGCS